MNWKLQEFRKSSELKYKNNRDKIWCVDDGNVSNKKNTNNCDTVISVIKMHILTVFDVSDESMDKLEYDANSTAWTWSLNC
jgi:hypothetical protein